MKSNWLKKGLFVIVAICFFAVGCLSTYLYFYRNNLLQLPSTMYAINIAKTQYVDPVTDQMMAKGIIQGTGDPYSVFLTKEEYKTFENQLAESYVGIGVLIQDMNGKMVIQKVFKNSPAEKFQLKIGWEILNVDGVPVTGKGIEFVAGKIKGLVRTQTTITFFDPVSKKNFTFTLTRANVKFETVESKMLLDQTAYIIIHSFNEGTARDFNQHMDQLLAQHPKRMILDLRGNGGGILEETVEIARRFLPNDSILFYTRGRDKVLETRRIGSSRPIGCPLIVLVNQFSASASEVLSGAIQDNKVGRILGEKTYGKASIQRVFPNPITGEAVKITVQKYLTPNKTDITSKGITPDIIFKYNEKNLFASSNFDEIDKDEVVQFALKQFK